MRATHENIFCIFSAGRSGSHLLKSLLESQETITCHGEIFHPRPVPPRKVWKLGNYSFLAKSTFWGKSLRSIAPQVLLDIYGRLAYSTIHQKSDRSIWGFLAWYRDAKNYPEILRWIRNRRIKIIHLVRENQLKAVVSRQVALRTKVWYSTQPVAKRSVYLDPQKILSELELRYQQIADFRVQCAASPHIELTYESLVNNRDLEMSRLLNFLGVEKRNISSSNLVKMNPDALRTIIKNYDEIGSVLKGTQFERLLECV